jgi:hypothetical protein
LFLADLRDQNAVYPLSCLEEVFSETELPALRVLGNRASGIVGFGKSACYTQRRTLVL